jgi:hypothetical protein
VDLSTPANFTTADVIASKVGTTIISIKLAIRMKSSSKEI